jgi:hypothetical protein
VSESVKRARSALNILNKTHSIDMFVTYGLNATEDAYRAAPEVIGGLVAEVERLSGIRTTRQYVAAYRADNGNVCAIGKPPTVIREDAEQDAEAMRSPEDQTEVFVAYRDLPEWKELPRRVCRPIAGEGDR